MRKFFALASLAFLAAAAPVLAGRLDVAVIQFPEEKTPEGLAQAFSAQSLFEITNSNRTMTTESYLKGGYVIFGQSLSVNPGSAYASSTRLGNSRADVSGRLGNGTVDVRIEIVEGVKAGLRSFENRVYEGSGDIKAGVPEVLSIRQIKGKAPRVEKGQAKMATYGLTTVVVAQYTP